MILWSKTNTNLEEPKRVELVNIKKNQPLHTPVNTCIFGFKLKKRINHDKSTFKQFFDKCKFTELIKGKSKELVLSKLRELCKVKIQNRIPYFIRRKKNKSVYIGGKCVACGIKSTVYHHVIMIVNGGPNRKENLVPLCTKCHQEVHPWIVPKEPQDIVDMDKEFRHHIEND